MANRSIQCVCVDCDVVFDFSKAREHYESGPHIQKAYMALPEDLRRRIEAIDGDSRRSKKPSRMSG